MMRAKRTVSHREDQIVMVKLVIEIHIFVCKVGEASFASASSFIRKGAFALHIIVETFCSTALNQHFDAKLKRDNLVDAARF